MSEENKKSYNINDEKLSKINGGVSWDGAKYLKGQKFKSYFKGDNFEVTDIYEINDFFKSGDLRLYDVLINSTRCFKGKTFTYPSDTVVILAYKFEAMVSNGILKPIE